MQKEQFGILLTTLRKKNGISQKEMADGCQLPDP